MKRQGFARAAFVVLGTGVLMLCGGCFSAPDPGELSLYDVPEYFRGEDQYVLLVEAENFEADYDIEIDYREAEDGVDFDKIIDDIAEGSEKYDIYAVRATMADAVRIQEKHAYADLSGSEILTGIVSKMYGTVAQSLWQGEELFAMPWEVDGEVLCYNPTEYPQYTQEDYQNWDSLLTIIETEDQSRMYRLVDSRVYVDILTQYLNGYCDLKNGVYDFDTPEFRKTMQLMKRVHDMNLSKGMMGQGIHGVEETLREGEIFGWAELSGYRYCQDYPLTTVSIAGEQGTFEVKQTYIMVNPNSKKKEQAIAYLEAMYQNPVVGEDIFLFPNEDYPEIQELMEHHACYSLEYSDKIREMNMLLKPFLEADMSEDEAIEKLTEYAKGLQE